MVDVVGALFIKNGRVFICQRPEHKGSGLKWEFPGGKQEPGETCEEALIRECREELDCPISCGSREITVVYEYPDITVRLTLIRAEMIDGEFTLLEHNACAWVSSEELRIYDLCPADMAVLPEIQRLLKKEET